MRIISKVIFHIMKNSSKDPYFSVYEVENCLWQSFKMISVGLIIAFFWAFFYGELLAWT